MADWRHQVARTPGGMRISLEGELDLRVAAELRRVLSDSIAGSRGDVVVDLGKTPFIDSSIVATLVAALKEVRSRGGTLRVENCQPAVWDTFDITRLRDVFGIE